jgi:hypothetical protein
MPIAATDIEYRLSGGANNTDPNASLGGAMSTLAGGLIATGVDNNLFDDVSGDEAAVGRTEYRGFYVRNNHGALTWQGVVAWLSALTTSADTEFDIGLAVEAVNTAMATIANETTAPAGVTFSRPTTKATGLVIGNIPAGQFKGIWIRRTVNPGAAAFNADAGTVSVSGDTAA